jgi:UDP-N-acetylmuramate dehydrogenase
MNLPKALKRFKGEIKFNEPLSRQTTFKIGGKVRIWAKPNDLSSLRLLLKFAGESGLPILIIGNGSNILASDDSIEALAINLSAKNFSKISIDSKEIVAGAGINLGQLIKRCARAKKGGLEFLAGIPATLGGAIWMNAAAISEDKIYSTADILDEVRILTPNGRISNIKRSKIKFGYKTSNLPNCIILSAGLNLKNKSRNNINKIISKNIKRRANSQELKIPSAGCIFKNPSNNVSSGISAGYLIDRAGLKGRSIGRAQISKKHANFIVNLGRAKAGDVIRLIKLIRKKVLQKFAIELEPEIKIISNSRKFLPSGKVRFL